MADDNFTTNPERQPTAKGGGVSEPVLLRAFEYWHNVDKNIGARIETAVRAAWPTD